MKKYFVVAPVMFMAVLMIVCTREESIKYGTIIFAVCAIYMFIVSKMPKKAKSNQAKGLANA
jgi:hypothetical protein